MNFIRIVVCCLVLLAACNSKRTRIKDPLLSTIPMKEARYDLKFFRELLDDAHPSLYEYLSEKRVNFIFDSITATIKQKITLRDLYNQLTFISNEIGCSHTFTELPSITEDTLYKRSLFFPFPTILLNNKLYINSDRVLDHGTRILSINGLSAERILDSLALYNPVDGYHRATQKYTAAADFGYQYYLRFGCPEKFKIVVQEEKEEPETLVFNPVTLSEYNDRQADLYYFDATDVPYYFRINNKEKYALMRITDFSMDSDNGETAFKDFMHNSFELLHYKKDIRNLIIDLRENEGGYLHNCFLLFSYLSKSDFREYKNVFTRLSDIPYTSYLAASSGIYDTSEMRKTMKDEFKLKVNRGYSIPDSLIKTWKPDRYRFNGNVFIISNHTVMSAASYFAVLARKGSGARIVGTETAGGAYSGNGFHMLKYQLPQSGIRVRFPYARMQYDIADDQKGRGIIPDYQLPDTYESFDNNDDLQVKFIIDSILSKNR